LFERPKGGERAVLVHLNLDPVTGKELLQEFTELPTPQARKSWR